MKDFFTNELHTRAVEVREAKEAVESARAGLSQQKGDVRKKRIEKKKTKVGEKVAPAKARFRVPLTKNSFFGSRVFGFGSGPSWLKYRLLRDLVYEMPCAKEVPKTDYFTQRKQHLEWTTLRRLKIPLRSIRSKEGPHYCLGAKREQESCHLTSNNQPFHELGILGDSYLGFTA